MSEFNLSEKIQMDSEYLDWEMLKIEDVKEFIRLLKEEMNDDDSLDYSTQVEIERKIDKLAGEKLT